MWLPPSPFKRQETSSRSREPIAIAPWNRVFNLIEQGANCLHGERSASARSPPYDHGFLRAMR
jgi:hypothetical protein